MSTKDGLVIWFTGLPCSGKTTLATRVGEALLKEGLLNVEFLDGDSLRKLFGSDLSFSKEDREKQMQRATILAKMLAQNGIIVLASLVSPFSLARFRARKQLETVGTFVEVYLKCPLSVCEQRDVKGMYAKARRGELLNFTGVDGVYEEPVSAELVLETWLESVEESTAKVMDYLKQKGLLSK